MDIAVMRFDIKMGAGRDEVHKEVCTYCTTAFEEGGVVFIVRPSGLHAHACTWSN